MTSLGEESPEARVSRTARYRKVTKPLLERRRRARINRCLDELKDLMVGALEVERENISKLEKADILELTVRHLSKLREPRDPRLEAERFQAGFGHCAAEAYHFILSSPGVDSHITQQLVRHLNSQMNDGHTGLPLSVQQPFSSPVPSISPTSSSRSTYSPNYQQESRQSSPSISPMEENGRNYRGWKEEPASVPVERSLTCDVPYLTCHTDRRAGEPMTGLLMTVNENQSIDNTKRHSENYPVQEARNQMPGGREQYKQEYNSERKSEILKKIREHIMERQLREPDSTESSKRNAHLQHHSTDSNQQHYEQQKINESSQVHHSKIVDLSSTDIRSVNNHQVEVTAHKTDHNLPEREEAINLSSLSEIQKEAREHQESLMKPKKLSTESNLPLKLKRKQTDYKSIHPKKVMIRTPNNMNYGDSSSSERENDIQYDVNNSENQKSYSSKQAHFPREYPENYQNMERVRENQMLYRNLPVGANDIRCRQDPQRYRNDHYFNREQYYQDPCNEHDDMWRPW